MDVIKKLIIAMVCSLMLVDSFTICRLEEKQEYPGETTDEDELEKELNIDLPTEKTIDYSEIAKNNNSISMLNYLTVLSQKINSSKNSRMFLEEAYSSIINDTYPNAVDSRTKIQLENMLDTIENFRMLQVKRERLLYLYEQNQAQAIRSAIPNPLALLSVTNAFDFKRLILSGIYMAVDSITSYAAYKEQADLQYLKDGWELDDEEDKEVADNRKHAFMYMVDIVNANNLPGEYALNEESVQDLVKIENTTNTASRIQFLEDNKSSYSAYGGYWLLLAKSYFEEEEYSKCLDAVDKYLDLDTHIFRRDYELAKVLPYAIASCEETGFFKSQKANNIKKYVELLIANTKNSDWQLRYFAAQSYVKLYQLTNDKNYLEYAWISC